jgi:UDP-N-acetylmuramyl pentapeptide phosphotransferase/UDP-N-acetylglucosamine-1-phosphate transferase
MSGAQVAIVVFAAAISAGVAWLVAGLRLRAPAPALVRTNYAGEPVAAVLGDALLAAALWSIVVVSLAYALGGDLHAHIARTIVAVGLVTAVLWAAGRWDDLRGDERPRGFAGHLVAARGGLLTGGLVKLLAGGLVGLGAGALLTSGWSILETGAVVALTANLVNLTDRAPGRASKVGILVALPLVVWGDRSWVTAAAGLLAGMVACLPADLSARGMLGDAGANPLGGVIGLGLALSLGESGRLVAIAALVVLNALSERFSFSRAIEATPPLKWLDLLGRK